RRCGSWTSGTSRPRCSRPRPRPGSPAPRASRCSRRGPGGRTARARWPRPPLTAPRGGGGGGRGPAPPPGAGGARRAHNAGAPRQAITKRAWTEHEAARVGPAVDEAFRIAGARHRGPVFLDVSLEGLFGTAEPDQPTDGGSADHGTADYGDDQHDPAAMAAIGGLLAGGTRPVLVLGSDVWLDSAEEAARLAAEQLALPVIANGQGRGILPPGHELLVTRARSVALGEADLVVVAGTPLDFRLA